MKVRHTPESNAERRADLAGFVDVLTELDKMSRWGADRRHNIGLTVRQRIMLSMASLRSSVYIYISCCLGVGSMYMAWRAFGFRGAVIMLLAVMMPSVTTVAWLAVRMAHGQGAVWSQAARRVCLGLAEGASCFLFVNGIIVGLCILIRRGLIALSHYVADVLQWALEGTDIALEKWVHNLQPIWGGLDFTLHDAIQLTGLIAGAMGGCVALPAVVYIWVHAVDERRSRKVKEMFL